MTSYTYDHLELGDEHSLGCKCCRLKNGHDLPVPRKLSPDEISKHARRFSSRIFADWTKLNGLIKRFEETIQKRWLRKPHNQKRDILLKAWPDMPATHRPDFKNFRNSDRRSAPRFSTMPSKAYLWPHHNREDLQQPRLLLLYLNSRSRNLPEMFIKTDVGAAHLGVGWHSRWDASGEETTKIEYNKLMMRFRSQKSPRAYGRPVPFSVACKSATIEPLDATYGLLALEIQQGIYSFLLTCVELILHDMDIGSSQYYSKPHTPQPSLPEASQNEWPSLTAHMIEAPYLVPQKMDLDRLKTLVAARRAAAEDHLWMIREDPAYFVDSLRDWKEHSQAMLLHHCQKCWQNIAADMLSDACCNFMAWRSVYVILDVLPPLEEQLQNADWVKMRLRTAHEEAWATLLNMIEVLEMVALHRLRKGLPPSPRMRHCYDWQSVKYSGGEGWDHLRGFTEAESRVNMLFCALTNDVGRELHGLDRLVQEIQYMLDKDPAASYHVDSWVTGYFSDLAMLSELRLRITALEPWYAIWKDAGMQESKTVVVATSMFDELNQRLQDAFGQTFDEATLIGDPLDGTFDYPAGKQYNEANVEQMRRAEKSLDQFWAQVEFGVANASGLSLNKLIEKSLHEPRELHRTLAWTPPAIPPKKTPVLAELNSNTLPLRNTYTATVETPTTRPRVKVKTRGTPTPQSASQSPRSQQRDSTVPPQSSQPVQLPKRTYKVFAALLPASSAVNHQRVEISWDELLLAMSAIGLQPEKLYGSVWIFKPKAPADCLIEMNRSIQFHEPKEVRRGGKIPANMVRTLGRRLKYAYGWEGGMFVSQ